MARTKKIVLECTQNMFPRSQADAFNNAELSDFVLCIDLADSKTNESVRYHLSSHILAPVSSYFKSLLIGKFVESQEVCYLEK